MNTRSNRTPRTAQTSTENIGASNIPVRSTPTEARASPAKSLTLSPKTPAGGRTPKPNGRSAEKATRAQPGTPVAEPAPAKTFTIDSEGITLLDFGLQGDILLDVTFDNTYCRRSLLNLETGQQPRFSNAPLAPKNIPNERVVYRVQLETLKKTSKYFDRLLTDERFSEAKAIKIAFSALHSKGIKPSEAPVEDLPRISIKEDSDATQISGRSGVFSDLLRILHGQDTTSKLSIPYLTILAVMADRFDCASTIGRYTRGARRIAWPVTSGGVTFNTEEVTRMKVLVAWYLEDIGQFGKSTKELIMRGSLRWSGRGDHELDRVGIWWDLPDGIEAELHHRRACILHTIASLQTHFISLYTSKQRQCKMFYDSSVACDSFQLGEMIRFFVSKTLFTFLSPISPPMVEDDFPEPYHGDVDGLIKDLRQCPSWQYDQNHAHCGLRTRLIPALDYIQAMLNQGVSIDWKQWKRDQIAASWESEDPKPFVLVKGAENAVGDPRLSLKEILATPVGRQCFTARSWDWTGDGEASGKEMLGARFGKATWKIPD